MHQKIKKNKKNILILGGGFCGLRVAKHLAKKLRFHKEYQIILIDRKENQIYHADLYEISTAYNKRISKSCLRALKETVCIRIQQVLRSLEITFLRDEIVTIDPTNKKISLTHSGELSYEYMVLTLGSVTNYYHIPGLEEHALPLKTVENALSLNCHFDQFFRERWEKKSQRKVNIVVGGGGFTGVEYACELHGYIKKLATKYHFKPSDVTISIVQGSEEFIGIGKTVSDIAYRRFKQLGIRPVTDARIADYNGKYLTVCSKTGICKRSMLADILVWTGGVKPNPLLNNFTILDTSGALEVYPTLESPHYSKVYAGGDNAAIFDPQHHQMVPKLALMAIQQGKLIAYNIWADIVHKKQKVYQPSFKGFIVPLGGKYFVYHRNNITFSGIVPYLMRRALDLWYFASLLPLRSAFRKWWHTENIFLQND